MDLSFYILIQNQNSLPAGTIFEMSEKKLISLDDNKQVQQNHSILTFCEIIDKKSVMLIQPLSMSNRIKCFQDTKWIFLSSLDVGDSCWYLMNDKEVPCKIISKTLMKNGMLYSINLETGVTMETTIDHLKYKKNVEVNESNRMKKSEVQDTENNKSKSMEKQLVQNMDLREIKDMETAILDKTKNLISTFEEMNQQKDRSRRRETISFGISKNVTPKCSCFMEIFKRADHLRLNTNENQIFLTNMLRILPNELNGDDGRNCLHWASHYLLLESVTELIKAENLKNKRDTMGNTPLHLAVSSPLIDSTNVVNRKTIESILLIFLNNKVDLNIKNKNGDTVLTKIIKNADFNLLDFVLKNIEDSITLSNHLLLDKTSIMEFLIKIEKYHLANMCCIKASDDKKENQLLLQSAFHAVYRNYNNLAKKIIEKCSDVNCILFEGETFLTRIIKEKSINAESICFQLDNSSFDISKQNTEKEYPLLLVCGRFLVEPIKLILEKGNISVVQLNECLREVITIYTNLYIDNNYKKTKTEFINRTSGNELPGDQLKLAVFEIAELLIKNGTTIDSSKELDQLLDECVDQELGKIVKHLCRQKNLIAGKKSPTSTLKNKNECHICMDRIIDCSFSCGHTYCSVCADKLYECPSCRIPLTGKRRIYIS